MKIHLNGRAAIAGALLMISVLFLTPAPSRAQEQPAPTPRPRAAAPPLPDNITRESVKIWSEGVRMAGDLFKPKGMKEGEKLPAIVMSHGWGGTRRHLSSTYAPRFAAAGFIVLSFDYRGWADSDGKLVVKGEFPKPDEKGEVTVKAQVIREVIDPFDMTIDIMNAIDFIEGVTGVDTSRIGIWGTSYSGGHVVYVAGHDSRVKCIVSQVSAQNSTILVDRGWKDRIPGKGGIEYAHQQAIDRAQGKIEPIPQGGADKAPNLQGTPFLSKIYRYRPIDYAEKVKVPTLLIDAEKEELFDPKEQSGKVYEILKANGVPCKYVVVPGITHHGIYSTKYEESVKLGLEWFNEYLKGAKK